MILYSKRRQQQIQNPCQKSITNSRQQRHRQQNTRQHSYYAKYQLSSTYLVPLSILLIFSVIIPIQSFIIPYQQFQRGSSPSSSIRIDLFELGNQRFIYQQRRKDTFSSTARMGIKGFRSWFESQFPNAIVSVPIDKSVTDSAKQKQKNGGKQSTNHSNATRKEYYDHVLIDLNQLLHQVMRKSRSDGHGLTLLMKELDLVTSTIAIPTQSLVLAMDGPPSAAKLATQRQRRYSTVIKAQARIKQYTKLLATAHVTANSTELSATKERKLRTRAKQMERKKRRCAAETRTLCITPGTDFMKQVEQAIMYWAWQRLSSRTTTLSTGTSSSNSNNNKNAVGVQVYLSSSTVAGEGEVKLLEWIYNNVQPSTKSGNHKNQQQQPSIALLGGDSDLVLEGLVVPFHYTHNIFVLLPDGNKKYLVVNIWETTRILDQYITKPMTTNAANNDRSKGKAKNVDAGPKKSNKLRAPAETAAITPAITPAIPRSTSLRDIMNMRTDLAVLLILNGNDYLPKLRGSSGFNRLFHTYIKQQREWRESTSSTVDSDIQFLVNPVTLDFNLDYCIEYFRRLAALAPKTVIQSPLARIQAAESSKSPLQIVNNMIAAGFLPSPIVFEVIESNDDDNIDKDGDGSNRRILSEETDDDDDEDNNYNNENDDKAETDYNNNGNDDDEDDYDEDRVRVRVQLGEPGMDDFYTTEIWYPAKTKLKQARQKLAQIVLKELVYETNEDSGNEDDDDDNEDDDDDEEEDDIVPGITNAGFDWEIKTRIEGNVESYLYGLLWNLQTYQDGVCADYGYNYGKRLAPSSRDIVKFFEKFKSRNRNKQGISINDLVVLVASSRKNGTVNMEQLSPPNHFTPPVTAGISCLAALPSPVKHLVPEPYRYISDETVESIYASCMDPVDNYFYMKEFERLCEEQVVSIPFPIRNQNEEHVSYDLDNGNDDITGTHYWTVVSKVSRPLPKPQTPPEPFSERFRKLQVNDRMKISRVMAASEPRTRSALLRNDVPLSPVQQLFPKDVQNDWNPLDSSALSSNVDQVVNYKTVNSGKRSKKKDVAMVPVRPEVIGTGTDPPGLFQNGLPRHEVKNGKTVDDAMTDIGARMKKFNLKSPPSEVPTTTDGATPMAVLKQLSDAELIGEITWTSKRPSETEYASFDPNGHEQVLLHISQSSQTDGALVDQGRTYVQDRDVNTLSRKLLQHHLCSLALRDIMGHTLQWNKISYKQIRDAIVAKTATK